MAMFGAGNVMAQPCQTIASGELLDPASWSCDCNVSICDTLIVQHALTLDGTLNLPNARYTEIAEGGSLTGSGSLRIAGNLENRGTLALHRLATDVDPLPELDTYFFNEGEVQNDILLLLSDSTSNQGIINCTDSLIIGFERKLRNDSDINTNILYQFGRLYNYENVLADTLIGIRATVNYGLIRCHTIEIYQSLFNFGFVHTSIYEQWSGVADNSGSINVNDSTILGVYFGIDLEQTTSGYLNTRNLYVLENTDIRGQGSICILEHAENHGNIIGSMQLCDLTPTLTTPPFLDVHTGTIVLTPTYCGPLACATVNIDERSTTGTRVHPNPTAGHARITRGADSVPVHGWMVLDPWGRTVQRGTHAPSTVVNIDLTALRSGTYWVLLVDQAGTMLERLPVVVEQ